MYVQHVECLHLCSSPKATASAAAAYGQSPERVVVIQAKVTRQHTESSSERPLTVLDSNAFRYVHGRICCCQSVEKVQKALEAPSTTAEVESVCMCFEWGES